MEIPISTFVIALGSSILPSLIGYLTSRSIKAIDQSISTLGTKVDHLAAQDSKLSVELAELRVRVTHLELLAQRGLK